MGKNRSYSCSCIKTTREDVYKRQHLGYVIEEKHLAKIVSAVNALKPDIICIAGDIFDGDITSLANPGKPVSYTHLVPFYFW